VSLLVGHACPSTVHSPSESVYTFDLQKHTFAGQVFGYMHSNEMADSVTLSEVELTCVDRRTLKEWSDGTVFAMHTVVEAF
jgi:hypothetical protein